MAARDANPSGVRVERDAHGVTHMELIDPAGLDRSSFAAACRLLPGADPTECIVLAGQGSQKALARIGTDIGCAVYQVPDGVLAAPGAWVVVHYGRTVWSRGPA